ncbi:nitroreductase/quinone reductase family protein [Mariniluteicoccus flavus]
MDIRRIINRLVVALAGARLLPGARVLEVRGRRSGELRRAVVNPLAYAGSTHLVAPRGQTQWVRNVRAAGRCRVGGAEFTAHEVPVADRGPLLAAYVARWGWQVRSWMSDEPDAAAHPVFRLEPVSPSPY